MARNAIIKSKVKSIFIKILVTTLLTSFAALIVVSVETPIFSLSGGLEAILDNLENAIDDIINRFLSDTPRQIATTALFFMAYLIISKTERLLIVDRLLKKLH